MAVIEVGVIVIKMQSLYSIIRGHAQNRKQIVSCPNDTKSKYSNSAGFLYNLIFDAHILSTFYTISLLVFSFY